MINKPSCNTLLMRRETNCASSLGVLSLLAALLILGVPPAHAGAPDWLRSAAQQKLPDYPKDTKAVILYDEKLITVKNSGEIQTTCRRAYKILRPEGRSYGELDVHFDNETKVTYLKAWSIPQGAKEYEVNDKDATEFGFTEEFYADDRMKILKIPAADPGNVVGYEYVQKNRPFILESEWQFQREIPALRTRFILQLPPGWEFTSFWANYAASGPQHLGANGFEWDLENIPPIIEEPDMPPMRALAGRLGVNFFPPGPAQGGNASSWHDLGVWYNGLTADRRQSTPELKQKVAEITAGASTPLDKIKVLAAFLQREIRYVAIEIGIGGFQPHPAGDVYKHRYGDCKDKATLLAAMLNEIGVDSYYALIDTERGIVLPRFPSPYFNHVILAIRLPDGSDPSGLRATVMHPKLGKLLFFDPTSTVTPLGYLPPFEQANYVLLVAPEGGELLELPLLSPGTNRLLREGKMSLAPNGTLSGDVQEVRWGSPAAEWRSEMIHASMADRRKFLEDFLGRFLPGFLLTGANIGNLDKIDDTLTLQYKFVADNYAKAVGNLLVLRPRVLGAKASDLPDISERKYPVEFSGATLQSDSFEIALPPGYVVDDVPPPVRAVTDFAEYRSQVEVVGDKLRYSRTYEIKSVIIPTQKLDELRKFYSQIAADERSSAVLRKTN